MVKLIIQIPCYNEEGSLPTTLAELPRILPGIDVIEWMVIDDGSTDRTIGVARAHGVDHIVKLHVNRGLARAFTAGLDAALHAGADIIVNTDADNQYCAADIEKLVAPILAGRAELVIGARPIGKIEHFSPIKRALQRLGSWVVRLTSATRVQDAPSGFRAISRDAAMRLNVFTRYTYTLETVIQAGRLGITTLSVPVRVNGDMRPSRLVKSIPSYVIQSLLTILRIFSVYRPLRWFLMIGAVPFTLGILLGMRWLWLFLVIGTERSHVPSLILAAVLMLIGFIVWVAGMLADLIGVNRALLEDIRYRLRRMELDRVAPVAANTYTGEERSPHRAA